MSTKRALAIGAHPDDIEILMAGTLMLLGDAGYELHVMNVADGSCGSVTEGPEAIAARRLEEARAAAKAMGATHHPPIAADLGIFYCSEQLHRIGAVVREVAPTILLTHAPADYMEDHTMTCRLAVTAAFARGMPNWPTIPPRPTVSDPVTLYHALPYGGRGPLCEPVRPHCYVNIESTLERKRSALACHASQKEWLDVSQGVDSYLDAMEDAARESGRQSGRFRCAEGWWRHLHAGFCGPDDDPLRDVLGDRVCYVENLPGQ
jgi:LmbE family N-acetylglucosaminyl deacetylase